MEIEVEAKVLLALLETGTGKELTEAATQHIAHEDECEVCEYLADEHEDGEDAALFAIARNPNAPDEVLLQLAKFAAQAPGEFGLLCDLIRENPNVSDETLVEVELADPEEM